MAKRPDWEAIESAYRAGVMSIREIASQYEITHQAISKRAKKEGWERDLKAKVKARAENLVAKGRLPVWLPPKRLFQNGNLLRLMPRLSLMSAWSIEAIFEGLEN